MIAHCPFCRSDELTVLGANSRGTLVVCDTCERIFEWEPR